MDVFIKYLTEKPLNGHDIPDDGMTIVQALNMLSNIAKDYVDVDRRIQDALDLQNLTPEESEARTLWIAKVKTWKTKQERKSAVLRNFVMAHDGTGQDEFTKELLDETASLQEELHARDLKIDKLQQQVAVQQALINSHKAKEIASDNHELGILRSRLEAANALLVENGIVPNPRPRDTMPKSHYWAKQLEWELAVRLLLETGDRTALEKILTDNINGFPSQFFASWVDLQEKRPGSPIHQLPSGTTLPPRKPGSDK